MPFDFDAVADILACPQCRGKLLPFDDALVCDSCERRLSFPIVDGIPRLLVEESTELSDEEWEHLKKTQESSE